MGRDCLAGTARQAMRNAAPRRVGLCSACRGDYEDPDASALDGDPSASTDDEVDNDEP